MPAATEELSDSSETAGLFALDLVNERIERDGNRLVRETSYGDFTYQTSRSSSGVADPVVDWWTSELRGEPLEQEPHSTVTVFDAFSGSGGLSTGFGLAAESLGFRTKVRAAVDLDAQALDVHQANHETEHLITRSVDLLVDFTVLGRSTQAKFAYEPEVVDETVSSLVGGVDVIVAGPPCQGHSSLNNHSRHEDPRNQLYLSVPALALSLGARAVLIENVPGVVRDKGGVVDTAKHLLREAGYSLTEAVLVASRLGWPQTRKRYFLVGVRDAQPVPLAKQAQTMSRPQAGLRWAIGETLAKGEHPLMDGLPDYSEENIRRMSYLVEEDVANLPNEIRPVCHQDGTTYSAVYGRMSWDAAAPTITTGFATPGRGRFTHPSEPRTLTAREAARIQGFPDGYFSDAALQRAGANRSLITKWIGDAVPPILGKVAGLSLLAPLIGGQHGETV